MDKYPSVANRLVAGLADGLVFSPLAALETVILVHGASKSVLIIWILISYNVFWIYTVLMHGVYGQTLGKMAIKIRVVDAATEGPITIWQSFLRDSVIILINVITTMIALYYTVNETPDSSGIVGTVELIVSYAALGWFVAEIVSCLTNEKRRVLHDYIAGTVVISSNVSEG